MKSLLTLTTLALAASPLSAIVFPVPLDVPFVYSTNLVTGSSLDLTESVPVYFSNGTGFVANGEGPTFYTAFTFSPTVTSTGGPQNNYTFSSQWTSGTDGFLALYSGAYNPLSPAANLLASNDNTGVPIEQSSFNLPLTAGLTYVLVNTLNDPTGQGIGVNPLALTGANRIVQGNIGGPGSINTPGFPPPEGIPFGVDSTLGLVVLGAVGALRLRRNRKA